MKVTKLQQLRNRAEKVVELIKKMNAVFPNYPEENTILVIMGCIQDAYKQGACDASPRPITKTDMDLLYQQRMDALKNQDKNKQT